MRFSLLLVLAFGCATPEANKPSPEMSDSEQLARDLSQAFDAFLAESWLAFRIEARLRIAGEEKRALKGTAQWRSGGVFLLDLQSFDGELSCVRVGESAWVFDAKSNTWQPQAGTARRGSGLPDPNGLVSQLASERASFRPARRECDLAPWFDYELIPAPPRLDGAFQSFTPDVVLDLNETRMKATVLVEHRGIGALEIEGVMVGMRGGKKVTLTAEVRMVRQFLDEPPLLKFERISTPFTPEIEAAVRKARQGSDK